MGENQASHRAAVVVVSLMSYDISFIILDQPMNHLQYYSRHLPDSTSAFDRSRSHSCNPGRFSSSYPCLGFAAPTLRLQQATLAQLVMSSATRVWAALPESAPVSTPASFAPVIASALLGSVMSAAGVPAVGNPGARPDAWNS